MYNHRYEDEPSVSKHVVDTLKLKYTRLAKSRYRVYNSIYYNYSIPTFGARCISFKMSTICWFILDDSIAMHGGKKHRIHIKP
jgi:hypothetical protein